MHCFHAVRLDEPAMIRLRELARLEDEIGEEFNRTANRPRPASPLLPAAAPTV
jgi:hypothetical protein